MYLSPRASRARLREAENARKNRLEIVKALADGQITKRDLFKWGIFTSTGMLAAKHGLSPYVRSAYAAVPTGTPRSPLGGAVKFTQEMSRLSLQKPTALYDAATTDSVYGRDVCFPTGMGERNSAKYSYHTLFNIWAKANPGAPVSSNPYCNPITKRGPCEGRPPDAWFAHQRWDEGWMRPKVGYVMSWGQVQAGSKFHPLMAEQKPNSVWSFGTGRWARGNPIAPLIKARYGEPIITRIYNNTPVERSQNGGFGRNECSLHQHNAHNGAESDGACNAYHFPGTFYDYHWSTTLARHDLINNGASDIYASGPDGNGGFKKVPGDFRELQGTLWFHDHRFFFTAENVHKGNFGMINYYSGPDYGHETLADGKGDGRLGGNKNVNLCLPSGSFLPWGNIDFDVNIAISNPAFDQSGQLFFDIFDTDGFLGDVLAVNGLYAPYFKVLPRKYRFRLLNASMSRFIRLAIVDSSGRPVPFQFIGNDGNFVVNPITLTGLDEQSPAERYDIVVNFAGRKKDEKLYLVNLLQQTDGRKPDGTVSIAQAMAGVDADPAVGPILEFRVTDEIISVDEPGRPVTMATFGNKDPSKVPLVLTQQIPVVAPARERTIEWTRGGGDITGPQDCNPDCGEAASFPWVVKVNGQAAHNLNANRISALIPKPGEVEHWTYINGGGGWDHPIHLHFEEGVTIDRPGSTIPLTEKLVRKDVWRLRPGGKVKFQVRFGEYGGAYVNHCHNTVHEDFAMLLRMQLMTDRRADPQFGITPTPNPTPDGVTYTTPEVLPEADPKNANLFPGGKA